MWDDIIGRGWLVIESEFLLHTECSGLDDATTTFMSKIYWKGRNRKTYEDSPPDTLCSGDVNRKYSLICKFAEFSINSSRCIPIDYFDAEENLKT